MSEKKSGTTERLTGVLGFDPAKRQSLTRDILQEVVGEAQKERYEKAKEEARVKVRKLMELREQASKLEKEFNRSMQQFEKDAGKLLNEIESSLRGADGSPAPEESASGEEPAAQE